MQSRKIVFRTSFFQVSKIDTYSNGALLFVHRENVRYPFCQGYRINKPSFRKFLNFSFYSCGLLRMDLPKFFPDRFGRGISFNLVDHNGRVDPCHLFVEPGKNNASDTVMDYLIDIGSGKVVFWTSSIQIPKIDTNPNSTLFFVHRDYVGHPFSNWYGVNETDPEKFFNFFFNSGFFSWMDLS